MRSQRFVLGSLAIAAVALVAGLWWSSDDSAAPPSATTNDSTPVSAAAPTHDVTPKPASNPPDPSVHTTEPVRSGLSPSTAPNPTTRSPAIVRGRVVFAEGQPAVAAVIRLHGWEANAERVIRHGTPVGWKDPAPSIDPSGAFTFEFDPPAAYQFALDVCAKGHAGLAWRWVELAVGSETDVGDVVLPKACVVEGEVLDAAGQPLPFPVRVRLESSTKAPGPGGEARDSSALVNATTGAFRIDDAHAGSSRIAAFGYDGEYLGDARVLAEHAAVAHCRITYAGPDLTRVVKLHAHCPKYTLFGFDDPDVVVLQGHPSGPMTARNATSGMNSYSWSDLPIGRYSLTIDDPRFLPWTKTEVRTGDSVQAVLVGSCAIALTVLDPSTRKAVQPARVRVRYQGVNFSPNEFVIEDGSDGSADGVFGGIVPGKVLLIVEASGFAPAEVDLGKLEPRTTIARTIELARGATVRGRVTAQGSTIGRSGVLVRLRSGLPAAKRPLFLPGEVDDRSRDATTDANGDFAFEGLMAGPYAVWAERNRSIATEKIALDVRAAETLTHDLVIPASGSLRARIVWRAEFPPTGIRIAAREPPSSSQRAPTAFDTFEAIGDTLKPNVVALANDGSFAFDALPVGEIELVFGLPTPYVELGSMSIMGEPDMFVLDTVRIEADRETTAEFDLGARHPGFARVTLTSNGPAVSGLRVQAQSPSGAQRTLTRGAAILDARGECLLGPLLPDSYDLFVMPGDRDWFVDFEPGVSIAPAQTALAQVPLELHRGSLLLVDEHGAPQAHRAVAFERFGVSTMAYESDDAGRIQLVFPAFVGALIDPRSRPTNPNERPFIAFEWPSPTGERVVTWPPK